MKKITLLLVLIFTMFGVSTGYTEPGCPQWQLGWQPNADPVDGYYLYSGPSSANYTDRLNVGNVTSYPLTQADVGKYFALTAAYDGCESEYTDEVHFQANYVQPATPSAFAAQPVE